MTQNVAHLCSLTLKLGLMVLVTNSRKTHRFGNLLVTSQSYYQRPPGLCQCGPSSADLHQVTCSFCRRRRPPPAVICSQQCPRPPRHRKVLDVIKAIWLRFNHWKKLSRPPLPLMPCTLEADRIQSVIREVID